MYPKLAEWDVALLQQIAADTESVYLEKKQSDKFDVSTGEKKNALKKTLAKAICAFSNVEGGFLVFGAPDQGGLDGGVKNSVGNEAATHWVEKVASTLLSPPVFGCTAEFINIPGHHAADYGAIVIQIPPSEGRPHWCADDDRSYLRVGARSEPMSRRTFLDISTRGSLSVVRMLHLEIVKEMPQQWSLFPWVILDSGPMCDRWVVDVIAEPGDARLITAQNSNHKAVGSCHVAIDGGEPLHRGRPTRATQNGIRMLPGKGQKITDYSIITRLHAGAAEMAELVTKMQ